MMWSEVVNLFREYMGTGLIVTWFLLSLIFLILKERRKPMRILFLYTPVILLLLYFNPLFAELLYGLIGDEIYYRILWLLPMTVVIAYTCVRIYEDLQGALRWVWAVAAAVLIMVSGNFIYEDTYFSKADNIYHVPDSVVDICDMIAIPGREVRAVFPSELLQYVRQYNPTICMPYGREITVERWFNEDALFDAMEAEEIDLSVLAPLVKEAQCHYIILCQDKKMHGNVENYNWIWVGETADYTVYRDMDMELMIPEE